MFVFDPLDTDAQTIINAVNELLGEIDQLKTAVHNSFDTSHPVQSYLHTDNPANPATYIPGGEHSVWELIEEGRVLVSARGTDMPGALYGTADSIIPYHNHTFAGQQMVNHTHTQAAHNHTQNGHQHANYLNSDGNFPLRGGTGVYHCWSYGDTGQTHVVSGWGNNPGSSQYNITTGWVTPTNNATTATNNGVTAGTPAGTISFAGTNGNIANSNYQPSRATYIWYRVS